MSVKSLLTNGTITVKPLNPANLVEWMFHFCIALIPVLYVYNFPIVNISLGTVIILGFVPYSVYYLVKTTHRHSRLSCLPFLLFYVYLVFRSSGNILRIILCLATFVHLFGMSKGSIKTKKIRQFIETFALLNVFLIVVQVGSFYVLHHRIQYVPRALICQEYQTAYIFRPFTGLYRPSALFLEPSHFTQYCIFALISALFPENGKANLKKAMAIGAGCVLTTSGMGIALTFGVFGWYALWNRQPINKRVSSIILCMPFAIAGLLLLSRTSFFQQALQRVFAKVDNYNAISGRTHNWDDAVGTMHGATLWFGYGDSINYELYLTGLADSIYKYGVLSVILEGSCFLYLMRKKKDNFVWCCSVVFAILFCVAHITNFVAQVFYFGIIISEAYVPRIKEVLNNERTIAE